MEMEYTRPVCPSNRAVSRSGYGRKSAGFGSCGMSESGSMLSLPTKWGSKGEVLAAAG